MNKLKEAFLKFEQFEFHLSLEAEIGKRRRIQIEKNKDWELILMVWGPESQTQIHDHNNGQCWTKMLSGDLVELSYEGDKPELVNSQLLKVGGESYIDDDLGTHQLINKNKYSVLSLHLYAAPIESSRTFDQTTGLWLMREVTSELMQESDSYEKPISP